MKHIWSYIRMFFLRVIPLLGYFFNIAYVHSITLEKLRLNAISIENRSDQKQFIEIALRKECVICKDDSFETIIDSINENQKKRIEVGPHFITKLFLMNSKCDIVIDQSARGFCKVIIQKKNLKTHRYKLYDTINFPKAVPGITDHFSSYYFPQSMSMLAFYDALKEQYESNKLSICSSLLDCENINPRIPFSMHQIWLGITGDIPHLYKQWQKKWKKKHPLWRYLCWSNELLKRHFPKGLYNQKTFDDGKQKNNYAKATDVARYEVIEKYGGLYADCDTQCLEPFNCFHQLYDFYGVNECSDYLMIANCVFGATPHHPFLRNCLENIKIYEDGNNLILNSLNDTQKVLFMTGPGLMTLAVWQGWQAAAQARYRNVIFPQTYFCPERYSNNPKRFPAQAFCFHSYFCEIKKKDHWTIAN